MRMKHYATVSSSLGRLKLRLIASHRRHMTRWMTSNRLKFNPASSELLLCSSCVFHLDEADVVPATSARNLGASMSILINITIFVSTCFDQVRRVREIRRSISTSTRIQFVNIFVISQLDYCNSLLVGQPAYQLHRVQSILDVVGLIHDIITGIALHHFVSALYAALAACAREGVAEW